MNYIRKIGLLLIILFISCKSNEIKIQKWKEGIIDSEGLYIDKMSQWKLKVYRDDGLLKYFVYEGKDTVIRSNENISAYQNWYFYVDSNKNLWIESSDVGPWVWIKQANYKYSRFEINNIPLNVTIPKAFYQRLPKSFQKRIKKLI